MKTILAYLLNLLLIAVMGCTVAWSQATAQISGTVKDQSGAVLPGVEIKATQTETNIERNTISNETGSWVCRTCLWDHTLEVTLPDSAPTSRQGSCCRLTINRSLMPCLKSVN